MIESLNTQIIRSSATSQNRIVLQFESIVDNADDDGQGITKVRIFKKQIQKRFRQRQKYAESPYSFLKKQQCAILDEIRFGIIISNHEIIAHTSIV